METKQKHLRLLAKHYLTNIVADPNSEAYYVLNPNKVFGIYNNSVEEDILELLGFERDEEFQDTYPFWETDYAADLYKELGSYLRQIGENL